MLYCIANYKPQFKVTVYCQIYFIIKDFDWRLIDHALKRLPILLPNSNLLSMKGNTKERVGWQLLHCTAARSGSPQIMPCMSLVIIEIVLDLTWSTNISLAGKEHAVQWSYVRGWHHIECGNVVIPAQRPHGSAHDHYFVTYML